MATTTPLSREEREELRRLIDERRRAGLRTGTGARRTAPKQVRPQPVAASEDHLPQRFDSGLTVAEIAELRGGYLKYAREAGR